ncbi:MAG: hypothetical protein AAFX41_10710 [Bacteroidota bacterium]
MADFYTSVTEQNIQRTVGTLSRAVAFLAMPAASYITGAHLVVDGAFSKLGLR